MDTSPSPGHNPTVTPRRRYPGLAETLALSLAALIALGAALPVSHQPASDPGQAPANESEPPADDTVTEAIVTLHSGRQITGFLVERTDEHVVIRINSIDTTFPRNRIARISILPPVEERYRQFRAAVDDDDVRARLALVEWLRARRAYVLALDELNGILKIEPGNPDATTLHEWISAHLELASKQQDKQRETTATPRPTPEIPTLTAQQINTIRVFEVDLNTPTRMVVPEQTMRALMTRYPESFPVDVDAREAILKKEPVEQLRMLFEHRARDLYDDVRVLENPPSMETFKSRIHGSGGWLINACASNRCHGGSDAGRLQLINRSPNTDETAYTNFLILERFRLADGTPLINHREPARSPLLHLALPRRASLYPHPEFDEQAQKQRWRHVFRSNTDRRFEETTAWIASLYHPRPDYGIEYPPVDPESEPATPNEPDPETDADDDGVNTPDSP